jgi:hypothetical protein
LTVGSVASPFGNWDIRSMQSTEAGSRH